MSKKVNPYSFRLGIPVESNPGWRINFYNDDKKNNVLMIKNSLAVQKLFLKSKNEYGIVDVRIESSRNHFFTFVSTNNIRSLLRKDKGIDAFVKKVKEIVGNKINVRVHLKDVFRKTSAQTISEHIASEIRARVHYRRIARQAIRIASFNKEIKGITIKLKGRLGGSEISRFENFSSGSVPLNTLESFIDYGFSEAIAPYGVIGIKVWINLDPKFKDYNNRESRKDRYTNNEKSTKFAQMTQFPSSDKSKVR